MFLKDDSFSYKVAMLQLCSTGGDPYNSEIFLLPYIALTLVCCKMAWLGIIFHLDGYVRAQNSSCLDPFYSYLLIPEEKMNVWSELELNPGPLASRSQATALTTGPWLFGH